MTKDQICFAKLVTNMVIEFSIKKIDNNQALLLEK